MSSIVTARLKELDKRLKGLTEVLLGSKASAAQDLGARIAAKAEQLGSACKKTQGRLQAALAGFERKRELLGDLAQEALRALEGGNEKLSDMMGERLEGLTGLLKTAERAVEKGVSKARSSSAAQQKIRAMLLLAAEADM